MRNFLRRSKLHDDLSVQSNKRSLKHKGSLLRRLGFHNSEIISGGTSNTRPSLTIYEVESGNSASQPNAALINERLAISSQKSNSRSKSYSYSEGTPEGNEPNSNPAPSAIIVIGRSTHSSDTIIRAREDDDVLDIRSPSPCLKVFSTEPNTANVDAGQQSSAIDASVYVSSQGNTYQFSGSGSVQFIYGSRIDQQPEKHFLSAAIRSLHRSRHAEFNMVDNTNRGPCTPQTRTTVLDGLVDWCNSDEISLYWMDGMAGTGKTTIAYTLCEMLAEANLLGASFFCSRSLPDCRDSKIIVPTIAFQLARKYVPFAKALAEALLEDEDILHRKLNVQLHQLLIGPWNARKAELPSHPVIVVDAVDECDDDHSAFLRAISDHAGNLPFKMMITSRPEPSIRSVLLAKDPQTLKTFILHEVEASLVEGDIARYVESQLKQCMPSVLHSDVLRLAWQCGKFFIYAATVCRFIMEADGDHFERFQSLLNLAPSDARNKAIRPIDVLYIEILRQAFSSKRLRSEINGTRLVLHTIICAREPLTRKAIGGLLGLSIEEVETRLKSVRSLVFVPQAINLPLSTFHTSLSDFMTDSSRSGEFHCHPHASNLNVLERCLVLMKRDLHQNICYLDGQPPNDTINPHTVRIHISSSLRYACVYWPVHWRFCDHSNSQMAISSIRNFLNTGRVLYWLECLSLIRELAISIQHLEMLRDALNESPDLANLTGQLVQCIKYFYSDIESSPMLVYPVILTWAPSQSFLQNHYGSLRKHAPYVLCGLSATWPTLERAIAIHSSITTSIAISQDGRYIISGSIDQTVRLWNVHSHSEECIFNHHTDWVSCVAICGDGSRAISGTHDGTVLVWDITQREAIFTFGSDIGILAVAITLDGKRIASGNSDGLVYVWDATDGRLVHALQEHTGPVRSVSFTPNGTWFISGSDDAVARISNVTTGKTECILRGHIQSVWSVACSPDSDKFVTGSLDRTARLWDTSGKELYVFHGHSGGVRCVAFMPHGRQIVSGSNDKTLRIWDVISGNVVHIIKGLAERIESVAPFPNGLKIASSSGKTISIWSLRGGDVMRREQKNAEVPMPNVEAELMVFSANGRRVLLLPSLRILDTATLKEKVVLGTNDIKYSHGALSTSGSQVAASVDNVIKAWKLTDDHVNPFILQGHISRINSVSFSHDARQLVSASNDTTAWLWDVTTRKRIHTLDHQFCVNGAVFSHDNTQIISVTEFTVHVWNAQLGEQLHVFGADVRSVAPSLYDHHIITSHENTINIYNTKTSLLEHTHSDCKYWTIMNNGSSYALSGDGHWICYSPRFGDQPRRLLWIPSQYKPPINDSDVFRISGPLFTATPFGVQVCLPRTSDLVTLVIPWDTTH